MKLDKEKVMAIVLHDCLFQTAKQYERIYDNYISRCGNDLTQQGINYFFKKYKPCRTNVSFFNKLIKEYRLNDLRTPKVYEEKRHNTTKLTYKDVQKIMYNIPFEIGLYVRIYLETALRLNELIELQKENIDIEKRILAGIGKRNKSFKVKISQRSMELLLKTDWLEREKPFKRPDIKHTDKWLHNKFREHTKKLGYTKTSIHQIRHAVGNYLRKEKGHSLEIIRAVLRHSSIVTTQIYARATEEEAEKVMEDLLE